MIEGVDIGAQLFFGNDTELLRPKAMTAFGRHLLGLVQPAPNGGLCHAKKTSHFRIGPEAGADLLQGFEAGDRLHIRLRIYAHV